MLVAAGAGLEFFIDDDPRVTLASLAYPGLNSAPIFDGSLNGLFGSYDLLRRYPPFYRRTVSHFFQHFRSAFL
jgi:hypothetical protein